MILADRIRKFVMDEVIEPARAQGRATVTVRAGDVHAELGLRNRHPAVCSALDAHKFLDFASVTRVRRTGPRQSSTVEWVFALN